MHSQAQGEEGQPQVKNYLLGHTVGEGTFGKVKAAVHLPTGQKVAVKIIVKQKIADVNDVERVARQLHILRIMRHPSIVQLYQIIETQRYLFIVTEYVSGGELYEHIVQRGHLHEQQACLFFQQLVAGLKYMHSLGVSHRDLKPENLLLDHGLRLKIIDFGLSNTFREGETLKTACGSPCYAAPQMLGGRSYDGRAVDIWSSGIILFAMVCGYLPFEDPNTNLLYKKILAGKILFPQTVSSDFIHLMGKILELDPSKRITLDEIEEHPWFKQTQCLLPRKGIKVGTQPITADSRVLQEIQQLGFDINHTRISVESNRHGPDYAAYYLQLTKMREQGYQSEHDINSSCFVHTVPDTNSKESFENTRKSYYFGLHELSLKKQKGKLAKSIKTHKSSPSKSSISIHRKDKIKLPIQSIYLTSSKIPKTVKRKNMKRKVQLQSLSKQKKKKQPKSYFLGDSPVKGALYSTAGKKKDPWTSKKKQMHAWRDKKNKSCSLIQRCC